MSIKNYQNKHLKHEVYIEPTTVAHHKFVLRCADCEGKYLQWLKQAEAEYLIKEGVDFIS
jgi:hypothetical protein